MSSSPSELKDIVLRAGAGAGKTTTLVNVFLDFTKKHLLAYEKFPRIVVTTFTRKATQELKERLLKKALEEKREDLFNFISSKSSVQISTIHGILNLFLSRYGSVMGLTPDYKILSENEVRKSARKLLRQIILQHPHLHELLEEYDFVTLEDYLLKYFSESRIHPELRLADKNYFAEETARVRSLLAETGRNLARQILSETDKSDWQTYLNSILALDWSSPEALRSFYEFSTKPRYMKKNPPFPENLNEELEIFRKKLEGFVEKSCYQESYWQQHQKNGELFAELAQNFSDEFEKQKLQQGLLSMADLEILAYKLIQISPESATSFSLEWDFWMVDEYQDTSPIQVELTRALMGDRPSFVVGDPQQSIYLFRGARSEVFHEKMQEVKNKGGDLQEKMINYRSNPDVLRFINFYFTRLDKQFSAMEVDPAKLIPEAAHEERYPLQVILTEEASEGADHEILAAVGRIQELLIQGVSPEKICLLSRTHRTLEETARCAQAFGVPIQLHSASGFFERREVLDALNLLKFLINPHDNYVFIALLRSPWFYLPDQQVLKFCHNKAHSFWNEALSSDELAIKQLRKYLGLAESRGLGWTLKQALVDQHYLDYSCRMDPSGRREANLWKIVSMVSQEERRPGFNFLDFVESGLGTLSTDSGGEDSDATPVIEPRRVNFMTVHASKGLQFDHVILPALGKNPDTRKEASWYLEEKTELWTLPVRDEESQKMVQSLLAEKIHQEMLERELQEFNRVLYVALTRAKAGITLIVGHKPGGKSWASQCPLNLVEGLHEEEGFSYVVRQENLQPQRMSENLMDSVAVRPLWQPPDGDEKTLNVSVTDLISAHVVAAADSKRADILAALQRAQQGTEAHRIFEAMKFSDITRIREQASETMKEAIDYLAGLQSIPVLKIIREGFAEWGFAYRQGRYLLRGQVDLWGIVDDTAWVIDYKTGSQKYADAAFQQMEVYAWTLQRMGKLKGVSKINLAVIYPLEKKEKIRKLASLTDLDQKVQKSFVDFSQIAQS